MIVTYNFIAWSTRPCLVISMDTKNENTSSVRELSKSGAAPLYHSLVTSLPQSGKHLREINSNSQIYWK